MQWATTYRPTSVAHAILSRHQPRNSIAMNAFVQASRLRAIAAATSAPLGSDTRPAVLRPVAWNAESLRALLKSTLQGDQVIVVSNRQPHSHHCSEGTVRVSQSAGGLVTALEPVARACAGTWIAHGDGDADRDVVDGSDGWLAVDTTGSYRLRRIWLSQSQARGHGDGFSNGGLWPLCHMAHVRPRFAKPDWDHYRAVNQRFADAVVEEAQRPDPIVLVQDYHLALLPALLRERLPRATLVSFWHIPWAHAEQMSMCPWLPELIEGLLGSDIIGFQTSRHVRNFMESAQAVGRPAAPGARPDIATGGRRTRVRDYPISIAWPGAAEDCADEAGGAPLTADLCMASIPASRFLTTSGSPFSAGTKLIVGVDRLDYTKGLVERLQAIEELLESKPQWRGQLRFVQIAAPTRTGTAGYAALHCQLRAEVDRINARFAPFGPAPVVLLDTHHDRQAVTALFRAADVCLVTSLHDGMNLVCKEFVAARDDEQGVLVLSQFAGATDELGQALIVNPYHVAQVADAIHSGLTMPVHEQKRRMRALRATVKHSNVYRWAARMLLDAAAVRGGREPGGSEPVGQRNADALDGRP